MTLNRRAFMGALAAAGATSFTSAEPKTSAGSSTGTVNFASALRVEAEVDVFVAGGGPAGICAALAAARAGKTVYLAEATGAFGGAATAAYVPAFAPFDDGVHPVVGGIGREIRQQVSQEVPINSYWTAIDLEELKRVYDRIITEAGVAFSFFTSLVAVEAKDGRVDHVVLAGKRGLFAVKARIFIDATGDADLVAFGGGAFEMGDEDGTVMPCTLCTQWYDIDFSHKNPHPQSLLPKAIADGVFSVPDLHLPGFFKGPYKDSSLGRGNIGHVFNVDPTDERSLTRAMVDGRRRMPEWGRFYKEYLKGYENMRLASTAPHLGVRESRRVTCDYMLGVKDFVARASFADEIGRYCYPVDIHNSKPGDAQAMAAFLKEYEKDLKYKKGESYGIPYRSLIPKSFSNVLVAGRCMGVDRKMQASIRVMPGAFITGQAAGTAAALAVGSGEVRAVKSDDLRAALRTAGAYIV